MLTNAIIVFAVAAVGGAVLAMKVLRGALPSWGLSLLHAVLGAVGLVLVALAVFDNSAPPLAKTALAILVLAALGGFYLASLHLKKKVAPAAVVGVHAIAAASGLALLIVAVIR